MAHKPPNRSNALNKVQSVLGEILENSPAITFGLTFVPDFAVHLTQWTSTSNGAASEPFPNPEVYFHSLPLKRSDVSPQERIDLDRQGVHLWNACCKVDKDGVDEKLKMHLAYVRAFAYFLLESASSQNTSGIPKRFRNGCRTVRDCIAGGLLSPASQIIERLADHQKKLEDDADAMSGSPNLRAEYYLLRILLCWKQSHLDMAEHFYDGLESGAILTDGDLAINAMDLYYEIGAEQLQASQYDTAVKWLKRAGEVLHPGSGNLANFDPGEMRFNVLHTLVRALLATDRLEAGEEARSILQLLKVDFGHKLAVSLLELEILSRDPIPNADAYLAELTKVIRTMHLIEANHKVIMHYIHKVKANSVAHALKALRLYVTHRLVLDSDHQRTEEAVVTCLWIATSEDNGQPFMTANELKEDLDLLHERWNRSLSPEAAHAVFLLLWKHIDKKDHRHVQEHTSNWCSLALHPILGQAGDKNIGKIQRRLVACHVEKPNYEGAKGVIDRMSDGVKQQPLSLYLTYTLALRCNDEPTSETALLSIANLRDKDNRLLLACVGETMKYGSKRQGAKLLQRILDKYNYELPKDMDTCGMLRCTAQLAISVLAEEKQPDPEMLSRLCGVFRAAANFSVKCNSSVRSTSTRCPPEECRWFERSSYNIALEYLHKWPLKIIIDLIAYSQQVVHPFPQEPLIQQSKLQHKIRTAYVQCVLYVTEARRCERTWTIEDISRTSYSSRERPDPEQIQLHLYRNAFNHFSTLKQLFVQHSSGETASDADVIQDLRVKVANLLSLAFEALMALSMADATKGVRFDRIGLVTLIDTAPKLMAKSKTYALFADIILSSAMTSDPGQGRLPLSSALTLLQKVIVAIRRQHDYDIGRAARWIRCLVQMVLDHPDKDEELNMVEKVVDEALVLARSALQNETMDVDGENERQVYPNDELEWLSTVLFNLAVDFHIREDTDELKKWVEKAMEVADVLGNMKGDDGGDGGLLSKCLRKRSRKMGVET